MYSNLVTLEGLFHEFWISASLAKKLTQCLMNGDKQVQTLNIIELYLEYLKR